MDTPQWLEPVDEYEGVGAPPVGEFNPRYDPVDEDDDLRAERVTVARRTAQGETSTSRRLALLVEAERLDAPDLGQYVRRLDGIDISHYQLEAGRWSHAVVRAIPTEWIAFKASQSTKYVDPFLAEFRAAGHSFRWANFYHWLSSTTDPAAQAMHFLRTMGGALRRGEGAMLDAEESGITVERCLVWLETVEAVTHRPCSVYTGLYVAGGTIWRDPRIRMSKYGPRPMHLAAYISVASLTTRLRTLGVTHLAIHAWQYSSDGPVPGIVGRCDMNTIIDKAVYNVACALALQPEPVPEDDDMKLTILARSADLNDPFRWVSNYLVRVLPTEESIAWLVSKAQTVEGPGHDIWNPERVSDAVLAGIPVVDSLDTPGCRFDPGAVPVTVCRCGAMAGTVQLAPA